MKDLPAYDTYEKMAHATPPGTLVTVLFPSSLYPVDHRCNPIPGAPDHLIIPNMVGVCIKKPTPFVHYNIVLFGEHLFSYTFHNCFWYNKKCSFFEMPLLF